MQNLSMRLERASALEDVFSLVTLLDQVGEVTLATIVPIEVHRHEHARAAKLMRTFTPKPGDLVVGVYFIELEHRKLDLLALVLDLLRLRVSLLLTLFAATFQVHGDEDRGVIRYSARSRRSEAARDLPPKMRRCS